MQEGGSDEFLHRTAEHLHHQFNIHHTTIQIERSDISGACHVENTNGQGRCWPGRFSATRELPKAHHMHNGSCSHHQA
jgi:hypothetical protein